MNGIEVIENAVKNFLAKEFEALKPALIEKLEALEARIVELEKRLAGGSQ